MDQVAENLFAVKGGLTGLYHAIDDAPLPELLALVESLPEIRPSLTIVAERCEHRAGELMNAKEVEVDGVVWVRSQPPDRKKFDHEALLSAVLDSRLVVAETGEVVEETPLERVKHVYPLPGYNARRSALKERGINVDQFCTVDWSNRPYRVARKDKKARFK